MSLHDRVRSLPTPWIRSFVAAFEEGRVQKHPQARFVNTRGECCIVGALAGARTSREVTRTPLWAAFRGSALEGLSRDFEARRLTGQAVYEEALLVLVERAPTEVPTVV